VTELTDRMRTCAAYIMSRPHDAPMPTEHLLDDAAELLIAASDLLEAAPAPLGEPMKILEPVKPPAVAAPSGPAWVDAGSALPVPNPYRSQNTCPYCDSRANKTVRVTAGIALISCPACDRSWQR